MSFVFDLAQSVGTFTLEVLWFPLLVWTVISGLLVLLVRKTTVLAPLYHYHIRVAMLFALPLGISGVALLSAISKLIPETHSSIQAITYSVYAPIYIQLSPATETSYSLLSELTVNHAVGIITIGLLVISVVFLIRLTADFARLQRIRSAVPGSSINQIEGFEEYDANIKVAHIRDDVVPFTFGCFNPVIILPESLKQDTDKQALTLRHELVHIERQDYALQLIITFIRSVFWFHPLVSFLEKEIELHRETSCDLQVLSSSASSAKTYAAMLYELSLSPSPKLSVTVGMALSPSTLKQRLQLMTSSSTYIQSLKKSMALLMLVTVSVMLPMACSDLTNQNADLPESLSDGTQPPISLNLSSKNSENYIVYVDGKQVEHESINSIDANDIQSVTLNKSEEGKSTIRIITKTNSDKNSSSTKVNVFT
ncbi:MAG: M56 family metallopeptidase, partial [Bacteroidota bacterium]